MPETRCQHWFNRYQDSGHPSMIEVICVECGCFLRAVNRSSMPGLPPDGAQDGPQT